MDKLSDNLRMRIRGDGWIVGEKIDSGGGGTVFTCYRENLIEGLVDFMKRTRQGAVYSGSVEDETISVGLINSFTQSITRDGNCIAALKIPKVILEGSKDEHIGKRLSREIKAMASNDHPGLTKILGYDPANPPSWFVMPYYPGGTLAGKVASFMGEPLKTLLAIRPVIEGVSLLHDQGYIHRDIKPNNIFLDSVGRLVLGDFGIVFAKEDEQARLTRPGSLEFSRDWVPDWVRNRELEDYSKKVDVFMLCKAIYFMITGGKKVLASQIDEKEFDLTKMYPNTEGIELVYDLICRCVTNKESQCEIKDAGELLIAIDQIIESLQGQRGGQLLYNLFSVGPSKILIPQHRAIGGNEIHLTKIYLPRPTRRFFARAGILFDGAPTAVTIKYCIGDSYSREFTLEAQTAGIVWTDQIILQAPKLIKQGWYDLGIDAWSDRPQEASLISFVMNED